MSEEILSFLENIKQSDEEIKQIIIDLFNQKLKGKKYDVSLKTHCGSEGHFIEKSLGLQLNNHNISDIYGYEIKKMSNKITFGDWSATSYIFNQNSFLRKINQIPFNITKLDMMKYFGNYIIEKKRYSWSGKCIPKYNTWNYNGTIMLFDSLNNLYIIYSHYKDTRNIYLPELFRKKYIILAYWSKEMLKYRIENKFNNRGFVIFTQNQNHIYENCFFGKKITFKLFVNMIKSHQIIFDSGMYETNNRNYSQFRASKNIWKSLLF